MVIAIMTCMNNKICNLMICLSGDLLNRSDPLGARYIIGAIEYAGQDVVALLQDRIISREEIINRVDEFKPSVIWISVQPTSSGVVEFIRKLSKRSMISISEC